MVEIRIATVLKIRAVPVDGAADGQRSTSSITIAFTNRARSAVTTCIICCYLCYSISNSNVTANSIIATTNTYIIIRCCYYGTSYNTDVAAGTLIAFTIIIATTDAGSTITSRRSYVTTRDVYIATGSIFAASDTGTAITSCSGDGAAIDSDVSALGEASASNATTIAIAACIKRSHSINGEHLVYRYTNAGIVLLESIYGILVRIYTLGTQGI